MKGRDNMQINILNANDNDNLFIADVCRKTIPLYDDFLPGFFENQAKYFDAQIPKGYEFYIIYSNEEKVGFICNKQLDSDTMYMAMLYLLPDYYRSGIGSKVISLLETKFKERNIKNFTLLAHKKADWAVSFYLKNNFNKIANNRDEVKNFRGGIAEPLYFEETILMHKEI